MTTTEPRLFRDALEDTLAAWPDMTGQLPPQLLFCAEAHPIDPAALCRRLDGHPGSHSADGEDPWTTTPTTDGDTR